ncbi:hypothetical protein TREMEDRAFT_36159 [Tremella mesenterica DSM 1558]|uniref:uncharacterized protein n=1 Tax=Tremella mesenterica (strain ATCC 24925 / CBS 8224 / DSM 1558 / NBRC 9311 / NRRL Y-6157 / RJB 2259-6 / UBC 559-6) TaxID=578456 RepID=UPI00032BA75A|nr:uncharacterized protein TREMEDRAFT_36159 [Tremella mesenterica DSM 1558]EIW65530.1 hypothetical protein TREMEDRAFT_36159 [Tremella mesenterica DSM 1558]
MKNGSLSVTHFSYLKVLEVSEVQDGCGELKLANGLKWRKLHGEAEGASQLDVKEERKRMTNLARPYSLVNIYNMDETGLFWASPPDRTLAREHHHGLKGSKARVNIYVLTVNADGSNRHPPLIIGVAKRPHCFGRTSYEDLGIQWESQESAWMDHVIFGRWLQAFDCEMRSQNLHILLMVDNFRGHEVPLGITNIRVEFFAPNLTAHVQPLDAGIIAAFKAHYRMQFCRRALHRFEEGKRAIVTVLETQ